VSSALIVLAVVVAVLLVAAVMAVKIVKQYEQGVLFRLGKVQGTRQPGLRVIVPFVDVLHRVSLRIVTMPIQSQGIITRSAGPLGRRWAQLDLVQRFPWLR
jgi:regulator of protease activity HflC (stomatin/prohibitin superfamily)